MAELTTEEEDQLCAERRERLQAARELVAEAEKRLARANMTLYVAEMDAKHDPQGILLELYEEMG